MASVHSEVEMKEHDGALNVTPKWPSTPQVVDTDYKVLYIPGGMSLPNLGMPVSSGDLYIHLHLSGYVFFHAAYRTQTSDQACFHHLMVILYVGSQLSG
jgi:hypothetical protein